MATDTDLDNDDDKPLAALDDDALFLRLKRLVRMDAMASSKWRNDARMDYGFESGDGQWSAEERAILQEQLRPIVAFNRIKPTCSAVTGMEVNNRQEVKYIPRTTEDGSPDAGVTEMYSGAADYFRDENDVEDEESDMFGDDVICGMGWTETRLDYASGTVQIPVDRIDPLQMYWDSGATKRNLADARRVAHAKPMDKDAAVEMFPGFEASDLHADWLADANIEDDDEVVVRGREWEQPTSDNQQNGLMPSRVTMVRVQWVEEKSSYKVMNPLKNATEDLSTSDWSKMQERLTKTHQPIWDAAKVTKRKYMEAWLGSKLLQKKECASQEDFTFQCVTGYRDRNNRSWFGIVRLMRDPQRWANKFLSTIMHQMSTSGKGVIIETDAVEDIRAFEKDWARPDAVKEVASGALSGGKIQPAQPNPLQPGLPQMLEFAVSSIRDVTGVNLEILGLADRQQAASLEAQRRQAATTMLASFFDSLRRYRKRQGRVYLGMIRKYIPEGTLIRIVGKDGAKYVPLVKDDSVAQFDVIVDEAATSPNQKEYTWAMLQPIMPTLLDLGLPLSAWKVILKASPLPESASEELLKSLEEQASQPKPPSPDEQKAQMMAQQQQHDMQMATVSGQQEMQITQAKGEIDQQKGQVDLAKANIQLQTALAQAELDRERMLHERATMDMETQTRQIEARSAADQEGSKALGSGGIGEGLKSMIEAMAQISGQIAQSQAMTAQAMQATALAIAQVGQQIAQPKKIVFGANGMPVGIEPVAGQMVQ